MLARSYRLFQFPQIKRLDVTPDDPRRMGRTDQRVEIDHPQPDLIAHRLSQPRCPGRLRNRLLSLWKPAK